MRWKGRRQSSNIEDRRSTRASSPFGRSGGTTFRLPRGTGARLPRGGTARKASGGGIGLLIVIAVLWLVFGINPMHLIGNAPVDQNVGFQVPQEPSGQTQPGEQSDINDEMRDFMATVLAETEDTWSQIMQENGAEYVEPTLVLFSNSVSSACGFASAASGPFYCPGDQKIYLDMSFFEELKRRFGAPGDFAQAYVLAHEVGHHIQNLAGILPRFNELRRQVSKAEANQLSIMVELQADCFAGIWANRTGRKGLLEEGDIDEALNAATQIGDDAIQRRTQGYVVPESFNHGTSEQRRRWFDRGFESGNLGNCDTFNAQNL